MDVGSSGWDGTVEVRIVETPRRTVRARIRRWLAVRPAPSEAWRIPAFISFGVIVISLFGLAIVMMTAI